MRLTALLLLLTSGVYAQFSAGASKRVITPDLKKHSPIFLAGFGANRVPTAVHDDLYSRCLALKAGDKRPLVMCGVDSIGLFFDDVKRIRAAVPEADVIVAALHDHQAPDTMGIWGPGQGVSGINETYNSFVIDQTAAAANEALKALRPATLTLAATEATPELASFIYDSRPPMVHDAALIVMSARGTDGRPIATLVNWANHPEVLGSKNTQVTADYLGSFYSRLEELLGGTAIFVNGAVGGMQSPLGSKVVDPANGQPVADGDFRKAAIIGQRIAQLSSAALEGGLKVVPDDIRFRETVVKIPVTNQAFLGAAAVDVYRGRKKMGADRATESPVGYVAVLERSKPALEIALVPGELYPELSVGGAERYDGADFPEAAAEKPLKQLMSARFRMLFGLANDEIGYIIPKMEWDERQPWLKGAGKRWYGEVNSPGPDTAPIVALAFEKLISAR
jgi:hypothetical protein